MEDLKWSLHFFFRENVNVKFHLEYMENNPNNGNIQENVYLVSKAIHKFKKT